MLQKIQWALLAQQLCTTYKSSCYSGCIVCLVSLPLRSRGTHARDAVEGAAAAAAFSFAVTPSDTAAFGLTDFSSGYLEISGYFFVYRSRGFTC
jgi:hypothetical protein